MRILPLNNYQSRNNNKQKIGFKGANSSIKVSNKVFVRTFGDEAPKVKSFLTKLLKEFKRNPKADLTVIEDLDEGGLTAIVARPAEFLASKSYGPESAEARIQTIAIKKGVDLKDIFQEIRSFVNSIV